MALCGPTDRLAASASSSVAQFPQRRVDVQQPFRGAPQVVIGTKTETAVFAAPLAIVVAVHDIAQMCLASLVLGQKLLTQRVSVGRRHDGQRIETSILECIERGRLGAGVRPEP
jgi:hypothetical protein